MQDYSEFFYFKSDIPSVPAGQGATRKVMAHQKDLMIVEVTFEEGADGAPHRHPHSQATYVVSGELLFRIGEAGESTDRVVKPGDTLYFPSNVPHCCKALTPAVVIDVFTPEREDFLK